MNSNIIKKTGPSLGKTTVIMAGVHGNEKDGIEILKEIVKNIIIEKGTVFFILGNPKAIQKNTRFITKNLNRCFFENNTGNTYEDLRAKKIMKILKDSDFLLDLHSSNSKESVPFLISEHQEINHVFPVKIIATGFDNIEPGGSDGYMNSLGKIGVCIESGSIFDNNKETLELSIKNFLKYTNNISGKVNYFFTKTQKTFHFPYIYKNNSNKFILNQEFGDFQPVKKGEIIGYDGSKKIKAEENGIILFARNRYKEGEEAFIFGKILKELI